MPEAEPNRSANSESNGGAGTSPHPPRGRAPAPHWSAWISLGLSGVALLLSLWIGLNTTRTSAQTLTMTMGADVDRKIAAERQEWQRDNGLLKEMLEKELETERDRRLDREKQIEILVCEQSLHRSLDYATGDCKPAPQP